MRLGRLCFMLIMGLLVFQSCKKNNDEEVLIGNWKNLGDFDGDAREGACSFVIGDDAYVAFGYNQKNKELSDMWRYDSKAKRWMRVTAQFPGVARTYAVGFSVNGKGYVGLGTKAGEIPLADFWEYDPVANTWDSIKTPFPGAARKEAVAASLGNKGYVGTGFDGAGGLKDFYSYTPTGKGTGLWKGLNSYEGRKRRGASMEVVGNNIYLFGGGDASGAAKDVQRYDAATDKWTKMRELINTADTDVDDKYAEIPRVNGLSFVIDSKIYYTSGTATVGGGIKTQTFEYDPSIDVWTERTGTTSKANVTMSRKFGVGFSLGGKRGFMLTGTNGTSRYDDFWEFFPKDDNTDIDD